MSGRFFFDCGPTCRLVPPVAALTGIHRIVRALGPALANHLGAMGHEFSYCMLHEGDLWRIDGPAPPARPRALIKAGAGDIILCPDANWLYPHSAFTICRQRARARGARVASFIHDILPVCQPRYHAPGNVEVFSTWLQLTLRHSDFLMTNSRTTAAALQGWMALNMLQPGPRKIHSIYPAASRPPAVSARNKVRRMMGKARTGETRFLVVGSLTAYKNQLRVLEEFTPVWADAGHNVILVFVGNDFFSSRAERFQITRHREFGHRLFWLQKLSDSELSAQYHAADILVLASRAEGFGLPILEARQHGLPVLLNDIEVFREVAGRHAGFFSIDRKGELESLVKQIIARGVSAAWQPPRGAVRGWADMAHDIAGALNIGDHSETAGAASDVPACH